MKKSNILLLFSLSFLASVASFCQMPVIISQPTTLNVCEGDSVTLEVIADAVYNLQWFTALRNANGFYNFAEMPGEIYYKLARNPVVRSLNPGGLYYFLRLASPTDTVWSTEIRLDIISLDKGIEDTIPVNKIPGHLRIPPVLLFTSDVLICSTGDTIVPPTGKNYLEFGHLGKHWLKATRIGCSRTDTFEVVLCSSVIHVDTSSHVPQYWCVDTVYIENDVHMTGGITVFPGTTVKFTGNYSLSANHIDAFGVEGDSICIMGNTDPLQNTYQGNFQSWNTRPNSEHPPDQLEKLIFKNMRSVRIYSIGSIKFIENEQVEIWGAHNCIFKQNKQVKIYYSIGNSIFIENDSVFGIPSTTPRGEIPYFYCSSNIFKSNRTGLTIKHENLNPNNSGAIHVWNNIFEDNKSAAITLKTIWNYIDQNLFINNTSQTGPPVLMGDFKKVMWKGTSYGYDLIFRNNTLYNNKGKNCNGISIADSANISGSMYNNIFRNINTKVPVDVMITNSASGKITISNNSFSGKETSVMLPSDTNFTTVNNLFLTDPVFSDTLNHLLTLRQCSPLIDKGIDISHGPPMDDFFFSADLNKFPRKTGNAVDIGAYEYHPIAPLAFSYVTPDTMACVDDSITLKVFPEGGYRDDWYTYEWYKNGNVFTENDYQNMFYMYPAALSDAGTYQAAVSNGTDTLWSPPIHVSIPREPVIYEQPVSKQVCKGMNVHFEFWAPNSQHFQYAWHSKNYGQLPSTAPTCHISNVTENDTLYVTVSNHCGSITSEPVSLIVSPVPEPGLGIDTCISAADSILLDAGPAVSYTWSTGEREQKIVAYAGDTVWVLATNVYSCTGNDTIVIFAAPVSSEPSILEDPAFMFYPNPSKDKLFFRLSENTDLPCRVSIVSREGKLISETEIHNREEKVIDVSAFGKGIYFIRLQSASASGIAKFIVL